MDTLDIPVSERKVLVSREDIIRFQLLAYTHFRRLKVTDRNINCLTLLGLRGRSDLMSFCNELVGFSIFASVQSSRNAIWDLQDMNMICKEGKRRKMVYLHPDMGIMTTGNIIVNYKLFTDVSS